MPTSPELPSFQPRIITPASMPAVNNEDQRERRSQTPVVQEVGRAISTNDSLAELDRVFQNLLSIAKSMKKLNAINPELANATRASYCQSMDTVFDASERVVDSFIMRTPIDGKMDNVFGSDERAFIKTVMSARKTLEDASGETLAAPQSEKLAKIEAKITTHLLELFFPELSQKTGHSVDDILLRLALERLEQGFQPNQAEDLIENLSHLKEGQLDRLEEALGFSLNSVSGVNPLSATAVDSKSSINTDRGVRIATNLGRYMTRGLLMDPSGKADRTPANVLKEAAQTFQSSAHLDHLARQQQQPLPPQIAAY